MFGLGVPELVLILVIILVLFGAKVPGAVEAGQWWRLITAGFLHGGLLHLLMNSWVLFDLVAEVEHFYGTKRLLVFYFVSTVTGFLLSMVAIPYVSVGASAPLYGMIGAMLALGVSGQSALSQSIRSLYGRWVVYGLVLSLLPGVDIAAHIGGLAGGFVTAYLAGLPSLPDTPKEKMWTVLAGLAIVITLYAFAQDLLFMRAFLSRRF